jgi:hypothetical protein
MKEEKMINIFLNAYSLEDYKQWRDEQIKVASAHRLATQAKHEGKDTQEPREKFLALVGRKLTSVGTELEARFSTPVEQTEPSLRQASQNAHSYEEAEYET